MTARRPPLSARELRQQNLLRRNLNSRESALYCGLGEKLFKRLVKQGRAPPPKQISTGRSVKETWDLRELDDFIDRLPSRGDAMRPPGAQSRRLFSL
ncbi:MAG TPA: hypothetical protein VLL30_18320 [Reyranella sp.]|nr:hypothetical protein [Reyranella sp.]